MGNNQDFTSISDDTVRDSINLEPNNNLSFKEKCYLCCYKIIKNKDKISLDIDIQQPYNSYINCDNNIKKEKDNEESNNKVVNSIKINKNNQNNYYYNQYNNNSNNGSYLYPINEESTISKRNSLKNSKIYNSFVNIDLNNFYTTAFSDNNININNSNSSLNNNDNLILKFYIYNNVIKIQKNIKHFLFNKINNNDININSKNKYKMIPISEEEENEINLNMNNENENITFNYNNTNNNNTSFQKSLVKRGSSSSFYSMSANFRADSIIDYVQIRGYFLKKKKYYRYKGKHNNLTKKKEGFGIITWEDGSILKAKFINSKIENFGKFFDFPSNSKYVGEYIENIPNGYGIYVHDNLKMEGYFEKNYINNIGIEIWDDDYYYQGNFKKNEKNGIGLYRWPDGTIFSGEWKDNKINGCGIMRFSNDNLYEGEFKNGVINGFGIFKWKSGESYIGNYLNELKEGFGIFIWKYEPINCYIGFYEKGKPYGFGIRIINNSEKKVFIKEGKRIYNLEVWTIEEYLKPEQLKYRNILTMSLKNKIIFLKKLKNHIDSIGDIESLGANFDPKDYTRTEENETKDIEI